MNETAPAPARTSAAAIIALVFSVLGLCCFPIGLLGVAFAIFALVSMSKDKSLGGKNLAILAMVLVPISIFTTGISAAVAVPAFINYVKRSKTAEAGTNLALLFDGVSAYVAEHSTLPPSLGPAPGGGAPSSQKVAWSTEDLAAFAPVHFDPGGPTYYVYRVEPSQDGRSVRLVAEGDLDDDGVTSSFELVATIGPDGRLVREGALVVERELE